MTMRGHPLPLFPAVMVTSLFLAACSAPVEQPLSYRLFDGAPPIVPHEIDGRHACMDCHAEGDAVDNGEMATITPHPELENCRQCHVPQAVVAAFVDNEFTGELYPTGQRAHTEAPLLIPHPLTLRENCPSCHGSDSAEASLRTSHPERIRCQQCHVPLHEGWPGPRSNLEIDPWRTVP